jgi:branched-chain amino acid transport system substrate-binding protein
LAGVLNSFPWFAESGPAEKFRSVMEESGTDSDTYGQPTGSAAWATGELFAKALARHQGEFTRASVLSSYYAIENETLDGLLPMPMTFTEGQPSPRVPCGWYYQLEDGEFTAAPAAQCL